MRQAKRKWVRRLLLGTAAVVAALAVAAWWLARRTPAWYHPPNGDPTAMAQAASRADEELASAISWAQDVDRAGKQARDPHRPASQPATSAPGAAVLSFTEQELNACLAKWDQALGWQRHYGRHMDKPLIVLEEGKLILAGTAKDMGVVLSVRLEPGRAADGGVYLRVGRVLAGYLPMPEAAWASQRKKLRALVEGTLPRWRSAARIDDAGIANDAAASAGVAAFALAILGGEAAEPLLFLPTSQRGENVPVKVTDLRIEAKAIHLTVRPLTAAEKPALDIAVRGGR